MIGLFFNSISRAIWSKIILVPHMGKQGSMCTSDKTKTNKKIIGLPTTKGPLRADQTIYPLPLGRAATRSV